MSIERFTIGEEERIAVLKRANESSKFVDSEQYTVSADQSEIIAEKQENASRKIILESMTTEMLPPSIRDWVSDVTERIESPFEIGLISSLIFIGILIGSKVVMRPKRHDDWIVVSNLWGIIIGRPSIKKTPVLTELFKSIHRLEKKAEADFEEELRAYNVQMGIHALRLKESYKSGDEEAIQKLLEAEPVKPIKKRYTTQDGTVEAILELIKENPNGILIYRDELNGWLKQMEKPGREGERSFYLEGWNGTSGFTMDRIGRGSTFISRLVLSVIGNIQPSIMKEYVYEAVKNKKADGFLQRFQLMVFTEPVEQKLVDRMPNKVARDKFDEIINFIASSEFFEGSSIDEYGQELPFYRFSGDAQIVFDEWYLLNAKEASEAPSEALEGHMSKYPSLFASLALIFHVCDIASGITMDKTCIGKENANRAKALIDVLKSHACKLYSTFEVEQEQRDDLTDKVLAYLQTRTLPISFREIQRKFGSKIKKDDVVQAIKGCYQHAGSRIIKRMS